MNKKGQCISFFLIGIYIPLYFITAPILATPAENSPFIVDFRYHPSWWQTSPNVPDDPDKPLVGKEGQFLFDWERNCRGPRQFEILISFILNGAVWQRQETISAKAPILRTYWKEGDLNIRTDAFCVIPTGKEQPQRIERIGGETSAAGWDGPNEKSSMKNWAHPLIPCDTAFTSIALGENGKPITYRLRVPDDSPMHLVFGYCEGWWSEAGKRLMKLIVEGGQTRGIDPVKDFGKNQPGLYIIQGRDLDGDGFITCHVAALKNSPDRNVILNALWAFKGEIPRTQDSIIRGLETSYAYAFADCGVERLPMRRAVCIMEIENTGLQSVTRRPLIQIESIHPIRFRNEQDLVRIGHATGVQVSHSIESFGQMEENKGFVRLSPITIAPGETRTIACTIHRHGQVPFTGYSSAEAVLERNRTLQWWHEKADLPWDCIQVPDPAIQDLLYSCIRNIWQSREIKQGLPAFHVGPTVYRCLWIVDGAFLLETAAILGRSMEARAGVEYEMSFQEDDGGYRLIKQSFWKENGLVLWTAIRHAKFTNDTAWLKSKWPSLKKTVAHIMALRQKTIARPQALEYGLLPPGFIDGGIGYTGRPEYSNVYWCLIGLKAAIEAANWIGDNDSAKNWQAEYDAFYDAYRRAAQRDTIRDSHGNAYIPIMMANAGNYSPQRGQWTFLHAVYPGQLFPVGDPLVTGNLAMLDATRQQGLLWGTGWDPEGIWTYAAGFYGNALLWEGRGQEAAEVLYAFANHASPTRVWREEQRPIGKGDNEVGDMPHNWASAEFIRLTVHLLALDRGHELHLLEGFPAQWTGPGMVTRMNGVGTPFGPLTMELKIHEDGTKAILDIEPLEGPKCEKIVVHLGGWALQDDRAVFELDPRKKNQQEISLSKHVDYH